MGEKYENKIKIDEIKALIKEGAFDEAIKIADTMNWSTIKNIPVIGMVSDLYKKMHLFSESRDVLLCAYERKASRPIVKSLCELSIELDDLLNAMEYFKEYVKLEEAEGLKYPDPSRYILQYKLYKAQDISIEEQIQVLEKLKEVERIAKWSYELAVCYHKAGMGQKCVSECDELIMWIVDGKYVIKAYELKALHKPLTDNEAYRYELLRQTGGELNIDHSLREEKVKPEGPKEFSIGQDVSPYNTQNLQAMVAEGLQDVLVEDTDFVPSGIKKPSPSEIPVPAPIPLTYEEAVAKDEEELAKGEDDSDLGVTQMYNPVVPEAPVGQELEKEEEEQVEEKPLRSDTDIIGQAASEMAAGMLAGAAVSALASSADSANIEDKPETSKEQTEETHFVLNQDTDEIKPITGELPIIEPEVKKEPEKPISEEPVRAQKPVFASEYTGSRDLSNTGVIETFHKGSDFDEILSQGSDGQISFVVPEERPIEKQITGQISIDDVMREWEQKKKESEERRIAEVREKLQEQTRALLADFDESTKSDLLGQIESAMITAALKEEQDRFRASAPKQIKVSDIAKMDEKNAEEPKVEEAKAEEPKPEKEEAPVQEDDFKEFDDEEDEGVEEIEEVIEDNGEDRLDDFDEETTSENEVSEPEPAPEKSEKDRIQEEFEESLANGYDAIPEEDKTEKEFKRPPRKVSDRNKPILSEEHLHLFGAFVKHRGTQKQLANVLENVSLAAYTGNILVTSEEDGEVTNFSKMLIQEIASTDSNFTGKVALVSGESLNRKEISDALDAVNNGALIITDPHLLKRRTVESLVSELNSDKRGVIVIIQGHSDVIDAIISKNEGMEDIFNLRIDLRAFDNKTLVEYARNYAYNSEYVIDELALLALHTRIDDMQTSDHEVTLAEIEELVDEAIYYADRKTPAHFFDILFGRRYNDEDMVILTEKDFMHR